MELCEGGSAADLYQGKWIEQRISTFCFSGSLLPKTRPDLAASAQCSKSRYRSPLSPCSSRIRSRRSTTATRRPSSTGYRSLVPIRTHSHRASGPQDIKGANILLTIDGMVKLSTPSFLRTGLLGCRRAHSATPQPTLACRRRCSRRPTSASPSSARPTGAPGGLSCASVGPQAHLAII